MWTLPRKPASLPSSFSFRLVDRRLLATLLNEPNKAVATALVLQETAQALRKRIHAGHFYTKAELHRTRVAAATAVSALRVLRPNDPEARRAASSLLRFLHNQEPEHFDTESSARQAPSSISIQSIPINGHI